MDIPRNGVFTMEEKIKAIEEQIEKLKIERKRRSGQSISTERDAILQKLVLELLDQVIGDLEVRKRELCGKKGKNKR